MRLIDEKQLVITGDCKEINGELYIKVSDVERCLDNTPTAYDIDKVVEQLEEASYWTDPTYDEDGYPYGDEIEVIDLSDAVEIVKGGTA